jgi:hypothetical protein
LKSKCLLQNVLSSVLIQNKTERFLVRLLVSAILDRRKGRKSIAELSGIGHPTNLISLCVQFLFICDLSWNSNLLYFNKDVVFYLWFCLAFCQQNMTLYLVFSSLLCKQIFLLIRVIYLFW